MTTPQIGIPTLLVYRECPCGNWLATGEGAQAPKCQDCGGFFVPGGGPKEGLPAGEHKGKPMFGPTADGYMGSRAIRGLAFVALLTSEHGASAVVGRIRQTFGYIGSGGDYIEDRKVGENGNHFTERERLLASDEILGDGTTVRISRDAPRP